RGVARLVWVEAAAVMALGSRSEPPYFLAATLPALAVFVLARPRRMTRRQWGGVAVLVLLAAQAAAAGIIWMYHPFNVKLRQYAPERGTLHSVLDSFLGAVGTPLAGLARPLLGWLDTDMPSVVGAFAVGSFGAAVLVGLAVIFPRKVVALSVYVLLALASTMYLWLETNNLNTGLQSRYFLPILYVVAGLALLPRFDSGPVYPTRLQVGVIVVMLAVANAVALLVNFNRYIFGLPGVVGSPRMLRGQRPGWWWDSAPIGPFGSWLIGSVAFGAALALCWWLLPVARNFLGDRSATASEAGG
ncbi:MAG: hypothetical protein QG597_4796, partial [Actinomycetota bacterium]|nr:hypothetical protein [Actinomycetota bacterium]